MWSSSEVKLREQRVLFVVYKGLIVSFVLVKTRCDCEEMGVTAEINKARTDLDGRTVFIASLVTHGGVLVAVSDVIEHRRRCISGQVSIHQTRHGESLDLFHNMRTSSKTFVQRHSARLVK